MEMHEDVSEALINEGNQTKRTHDNGIIHICCASNGTFTLHVTV